VCQNEGISMAPKISRFTVFVFLLLTYAISNKPYSLAQNPGVQTAAIPQDAGPLQPLPNHSGKGWSTAANRWQLTAVDPKSQVDTVSPSVNVCSSCRVIRRKRCR
jgi:hypothetical protein